MALRPRYVAGLKRYFVLAGVLLFCFCTLLLADPSVDKNASPSDNAPANGEDDKPSIDNHLRLQRDINDDPVALQTSIVRYVPASGEGDLVIDLVGVVHVGDPWYYQALNKWFGQYDVVLYELVAPEEKRIPNPEEGRSSPLHMIQKIMQSVLDLRHQLDEVDYRKENFVHADMSPTEMQEAMAERGDNGLTLMLSVTADLLRQQNLRQRELEGSPEKLRELEEQLENFDPLAMMTDEFGSVKLKRMMAEQFSQLNGVGTGLGATLDTILVKDRNEAAMRVCQKQIVEGKKRIAIFYGAAHMPDFEERLVRDLGMKRDKVEWMTAWDLTMRRKSPIEGVLNSVLEELVRQSFQSQQ